MKEIPILFSTPMVQAILAGSKTQTRRIIKPQPLLQFRADDRVSIYQRGDTNLWEVKDKLSTDGFSTLNSFKCPYGQPGDVLWVRESFKIVPPNMVFYKADECNNAKIVWKPSIHMPKAAARIWLKVVNVRVERLHEITEQDAIAEGILCYQDEFDGNRYRYKDYMADTTGYGHPDHDYPTVGIARASFYTLWASINGRESWDANPWVWVVEFELLSTNGRPDDI